MKRSHPSHRGQPSEPSDPIERGLPSQRSEPSHSGQPSEPSEPSDPSERGLPSRRSEASNSSQRGLPSRRSEASNSSQRSQSGQRSEPSHPSQPSLRRMREFGVRPKRELGQNFLIDSNILGVIEREARLEPDEVVLEIGGGLGVLSEHLAPRVAHLHVVELDRALEPALRDAIDPFANVTLHVADAMKLDLRALHPVPTCVVANLPYGIAAGAILRTIEDLDSVRRWVGMVQKEVGERLAAAPGTSAYGVPSVLAQLACDVRVLRPVSRSVFSPVPNVDSVLVGLERTGAAPESGLRDLVGAAFAHRRKALAGSLALAPGAPEGIRERAREALAELGHPSDERAERLSPQEFRALYERLKL